MSKKFDYNKILSAPDLDEIISKLLIGVATKDIHEWLKAKYGNTDKSLIISKKDLDIFNDDYLDFYTQIKEDLSKVKGGNSLSVPEQLQSAVYNNSTYKERLNEYMDKELDIKTIVKNMVLVIQARAEQVFDYIQEDNRNMRNDRVLIEWLNLLVTTLEKYDPIINGSPDRILQQNNINIQIVDQHINVFHKVIRELLSKLDYDTSMLFIDLFNDELKKIKENSDNPLPIDIRLEEVNQFSQEVDAELKKLK